MSPDATTIVDRANFSCWNDKCGFDNDDEDAPGRSSITMASLLWLCVILSLFPRFMCAGGGDANKGDDSDYSELRLLAIQAAHDKSRNVSTENAIMTRCRVTEAMHVPHACMWVPCAGDENNLLTPTHSLVRHRC